MEKYGGNGVTAELGQYETPFADVPVMKSETAKESSGSFYSNYLQEIESPFSRSYEAVPSSAGVTPAGEEFVQFLGELHDSEFGNALYELATEIEDTWRNKISSEVAMGNNFLPFVRQHGRHFLMPLAHEVEGMIDKVTQHFTTNNLADHSSAEVESFFSNLEFDHENFSPAQDQFFGKLFDKVKSVVKKGVDLAKKGIAVVGKFLPINIILGKIKGLIKPLLEKVLKFAIGKLPKNLQPYAQDLAKKFLNLETSSNAQQQYDSYQGEDELDAVQTELDTHIAQLLFSPGDSEAENLVNDYETSFQNMERMSDYEDGSSMTQSVSAAREQFINELKSLPQGESPAPAIERFLPALQPLIKIGISLIGREKVVNYVGGLLANLVKSYVPENVAKPLATSIVDIGLKVLGFETYEAQRSDLAYEAIANTIQETIQNMENMSETSLNDKEELTMNLLEAFEQAAANNFPPNYIREDLRKSKQPGVWVMMPRNGAAHYYKKFTHVFDVSIDPQAANAVTTYRSLPLANFLRDKLGLDPSKSISAKVHLYEATRNTRLSRISKSENLPGLNPSQRYAWIQLLPLTTQAATLLLKEPALGKDVAPKHTNKRYHTTVGQRFYFLEISGAKLRIPPVDHSKHKHKGNIPTTTSRTSQSADIQGVINFVKGEIRLNYYFSEEDAKTIVEKLNKNDFLGAAMGVRHSVKNILNDILIKNIDSKVKIIHEAIPELYLEHVDGSAHELPSLASLGRQAGKEMIRKVIEQLIDKLVKHAYDSMVNYFKSRAAEFKEAQAKPDDGVTIKISWLNIPGMSTIRAAINAIRGKLSFSNLTDLTLPNIPAPEIQIAAGKKFD